MNPLGYALLDKCGESNRNLMLQRHVAEGIALWFNVGMQQVREHARRLGLSIKQ